MSLELQREYAKLIAKVGANIQKGQYVIIRTNPEIEEFASIVCEECYKLGAKKVFLDWKSQLISSIDYKYSQLDTLSQVLTFEEEKEKFNATVCPVLIWLDGDDPDGLNGCDSNKISKVAQARYKILGKYKEAQDNKAQWCIAGVPTKKWAKKIFPNENEINAISKLWDAILITARVELNNSIKNWDAHNKTLKSRCKALNELKIKSLHYTSKKGTNLTVGLLNKVKFEGGSEHTINGIEFQPNIPTEECFTSPKKGECEGIVYSTKPLVYNGKVIDEFSLEFKNGKAIKANAKSNLDALNSILTIDEGSSYLGECAIVPYNSPINESGILFYNTLYDENASCHLALGKGFTSLFENYQNMSQDELKNVGINTSQSHVDFMIGDESLCIEATLLNGKKIEIFRNGAWNF